MVGKASCLNEFAVFFFFTVSELGFEFVPFIAVMGIPLLDTFFAIQFALSFMYL